MTNEPTKPITMKDAVSHIEAHGTKSQQQDIRKARAAFVIHGIEGPDFDIFPALLTEYEKAVPKLHGSMPALQALVNAAGVSNESYKQFQRAGRRLIEAVTGARAEKAERKNRDDEWAVLLRQVDLLVTAGLVVAQDRVAMTALIDTCRAADVAPAFLTLDQAENWISTTHVAQRKSLKKGLKVLDNLRGFDRLRPLLPPRPVTPGARPASRLTTLPEPLQRAINTWVDVAARTQVKDPGYAHLAEPLSESTRAGYSAATSLYVKTLLELYPGLSNETDLSRLFTEDQVDCVLTAWGRNETHTARTLASYAADLGALLQRNGLTEAGSYVTGLIAVLPHLVEGRFAGNAMGPKVKRWCETLLRDPQKTNLFQIQHVEYFRRALETLAAAKRCEPACKIDPCIGVIGVQK